MKKQTTLPQPTRTPKPIAVASSKAPPSGEGISAFFANLDVSTIDQIDVICISGRVTLSEVCAALERSGTAPRELRILMRSASSSDRSRINQEAEATTRIKRFASLHGIDCEIRHYACTLPLSGIMCRHSEGTFSSRLSFYDWQGTSAVNVRELAVPWCYMRYKDRRDNLLEVYESWFAHLWGRHPLHTILFDFDDTIFYTTEAQVDAWVEALQSAIIHDIVGIVDFRDEFLFDEVHYGRRERLLELFLDRQEERLIFQNLFIEGAPNAVQRDWIRKCRLDLRKEKTIATATPILEVTHHLEALRNEYQLIIVSSTSEEYIAPVLDKHQLNYFSYIFGRDIAHQWTETESKTPAFVRAAMMTGIPLSRMCFVGDSDADYRAARQLGLIFIENRVNARNHNRPTLVRSRERPGDEIVVDRTTGRDLLGAVQRVNRSLQST